MCALIPTLRMPKTKPNSLTASRDFSVQKMNNGRFSS
jgi:hypothetical protein